MESKESIYVNVLAVTWCLLICRTSWSNIIYGSVGRTSIVALRLTPRTITVFFEKWYFRNLID